ncbi:MAG: NifB/NifX family molybdenum-iron cluster-binding protein [candidate division WOR-3 bacterium]
MNTFTGHARGLENSGHHIDRHGLILEALKDCKVVISHGMGMRIYNDLKNAGIEVFITDFTDIKQALDNYLKGTLIDKPELGCEHKHDKECES